ncbi:tail protein X [Novosphingobium sp.]|uniref:tail protein X n=1 Tax=Novosphingobium sp. TaxID=1874826 RepID=UPI001EB48DF6|nr:tail protein X [Novosphingobium sp.]MBK6801639.1 tail protein X [Novosphingobium sp.]MBK9009993.1 tail protein X [Novosphingobium sp.]
MQVTARQGDTLDLLCWRHLGTTAAVVEAAYELNQGLADTGPILAEGAVITLPDAPAASTPIRATVNLWD